MADFLITYHGTVATFDVLSVACEAWVEENVAVEPWQHLGERCLAIDPSFAEDLRDALTAAGYLDGGAGHADQLVR